MGKVLVIKGADFSENGISPSLTWYIDRATDNPTDGSLYDANRINGGWAYQSIDNKLLQGKDINRLKFVPSKAGVLNFYKTSSLTGPVSLVASITITSEQVSVLSEFEIPTFRLGNNEIFVIGEANSDGGFKYYGGTSNHNGFYSKIPSDPSGTNIYDLNFSIGYYGI